MVPVEVVVVVVVEYVCTYKRLEYVTYILTYCMMSCVGGRWSRITSHRMEES